MILLTNPIDQFLIVGFWSFLTNFNWALLVIGSAIIFLIQLVNHLGINKLNEIISGLRTITADAVYNIQGYFGYLSILFLIILMFNMTGMIPYTITVTSFSLVTLCLSITAFIGLNIVALVMHNSKIVDIFLPSGAPMVMSWFLIILETISYNVRVLSLAIRLFANMLAGHALTKILGSFAWTMFGAGVIGIFGLAPWLVLFAITFLELLICFLQAYVFVTLVGLYINDILYMH